ncbi:hypothetical protein CGI30_23435 [Vibrio parahaemolyticus]|nr:hypothetical protein CGI30_23435 [Vibrio parahaemolyticus]
MQRLERSSERVKLHQLTKHSRGIHNAWQFWFESALVFTAQWFSLGGMRCSPLNAALYALWKMIQKGRYEVI